METARKTIKIRLVELHRYASALLQKATKWFKICKFHSHMATHARHLHGKAGVDSIDHV